MFVLGRDLAGPHVTAADVLAASSGVAVGIEVLDSRYRDYKFTMPDVVRGQHLGGPVRRRYARAGGRHRPAPRRRGAGEERRGGGDGVGRGRLGHPAAAVAWMVRTMAADGEGLRAGDVVLSGGLTAAVPVKAGDVVTATADRLGSVELGWRLMDPNGPGEPVLIPLDRPPGRTQWAFSHAGRSYAVFEVAGTLVVTDGACPHNGGPLVEGLVRGGVVTCPWHWYSYELATGRCRTAAGDSLRRYPVVMAAADRTWLFRRWRRRGAGRRSCGSMPAGRVPRRERRSGSRGGGPGAAFGPAGGSHAGRAALSFARAVAGRRVPGPGPGDRAAAGRRRAAGRVEARLHLGGDAGADGHRGAQLRAADRRHAAWLAPRLLPAGALQPRVELEIGLRLGRPSGSRSD